MSDLISREAALACFHGWIDKYGDYNAPDDMPEYQRIEVLSSAEPEPLTDKEQRIFLAAMGREEEICKEIDKQYTREAYEDNLVHICHEIKRKVKGALWT